jgi:hypothetical protein
MARLSLVKMTEFGEAVRMKRIVATLFGALVVSVLAVAPAQAASIVGAQLIADGGLVTAVFLGKSAGFTNDLYLFDASNLSTPLPVTGVVGPGYGAPGLIFTNQTSPIGSRVNLGSFAAGTELVFGIYVRNTGNTFFMGPGSRNPDGIAHGAIDNGALPAGSIAVGFEDLFNGGDFDYNDLGFAFSSVRSVQTVSNPEPGTMLLLGSGLAGVIARAQRRAKASRSHI